MNDVVNKVKKTIVVVGGVAGGASAATRARRCNESAEITLLEKDGYVSFANCGLPYYLGGDIKDREKLLVAKPSLFEQRFGVNVTLRHEVTRIIPLESRSTGINHATGEPSDPVLRQAHPWRPARRPSCRTFPARALPTSLPCATWKIPSAIKAFLEQRAPKRAVVVGAGFIGLEMVEQFHQLGMEVSVVELAPQVLAPLDPEMAAIVEEELRKHGVGVHTGAGAQRLWIRGRLVSSRSAGQRCRAPGRSW
jgi:NADPH-dependent 2,4-dienoyl-CoA reductase/sulfur reductase-like enzyme